MELSTFLLLGTITILVLVALRLYWQQILLAVMVLEALFNITWISLLLTILWASFISKTDDGWGWLFAYIFMTLSGLFIVGVCIMNDAIHQIAKYLKKLFS